MLAEYTGVLVIFVVAALFVAGVLVLQRLAGPRRHFDAKNEPFDCGGSRASPPQPARAARVSSPRGRRAVKFHLVAILFLIFLVEGVFFYLWAVCFSETGAAGMLAITVFTLPLVVGFVYEWAKGALEW
ncbi:MAG: NADH-quinone oxidoreductase subunit A [Deltaproteobacteria bacterium]|nr:NADH-quinone oxidoreductase subunit A [Deltaproteobacteria bacterium]MBW2417536.1 NADH-quinone oxidoreductase subunit A [Deltaproteobacteria bacterium]